MNSGEPSARSISRHPGEVNNGRAFIQYLDIFIRFGRLDQPVEEYALNDQPCPGGSHKHWCRGGRGSRWGNGRWSRHRGDRSRRFRRKRSRRDGSWRGFRGRSWHWGDGVPRTNRWVDHRNRGGFLMDNDGRRYWGRSWRGWSNLQRSGGADGSRWSGR